MQENPSSLTESQGFLVKKLFKWNFAPRKLQLVGRDSCSSEKCFASVLQNSIFPTKQTPVLPLSGVWH